ncbi:MAG TPA: efflux RND transporter periplasmic adaptor subunit [Candidatus Polarisedimenticolia bacterium]|nr:efflux RND transporter periplasmic adaptor subunit [Candidatus Polarisedimenticolia bacterium]
MGKSRPAGGITYTPLLHEAWGNVAMSGKCRRAVSLAAILAGLSGCAKEEAKSAPPLEVPVVQVIQRDQPITADRVGQIYGAEDIEIRARVAGFLQGIHFQEGTQVRKGQLLYTIDPQEQLQSVARARGDLASAKTRLVKAESDVKRYRPLAEMKAVSQADLDAAVAEEGAAQGQVEANEAALRSMEITLSYTKIASPIDGLIGMTQAKVGDYVGQLPNPVVLDTVSNIEEVLARFSVTERDYLEMMRKIGPPDTRKTRFDDVELILADGSLYEHRGAIDFADRQINPTTGTLNVQATFPNPERLLRPGQYARVRVILETRQGALLVPQRAVQELQGQQMVSLVSADGTVETRTLQMGPRIGSLWLVEKGLAAGDKVILEGAQKVKPGAKVVAKDVQAPEAAAHEAGAPSPGT